MDRLRCPCCGCKLRTKPVNPKLKAKLREERKIQEVKEIEIFSTHS
jgi:hypothetical protein